MEQSWERAWDRAGFPSGWSHEGFQSLWNTKVPLPSLFLNGTHVETGRRVITSNIEIASNTRVFRDVFDIYSLLPPRAEISSSTAVLNSARLPYVSPAGTLADRTHVIEGGYFENFGAVTGAEVLKAALNIYPNELRPVVIFISADPYEQWDFLLGDRSPR